MYIVIALDHRDPPDGRVSVVGADEPGTGTDPVQFEPPVNSEPFTGWLGLLAVLSSLMDAPNDAHGP